MDKDSILPLLPKSALELFQDGEDLNKLYLRATSIRNCLEDIVDTVFIHIIIFNKEISIRQWKRKILNDKIRYLNDYFPSDINKNINNIKSLGNKGTHPKGHKKLKEDDIDNTLQDLSKICEWTILAYFKKNGFPVDSWIPRVFSTLQPIYRIRILEELFTSYEINSNELAEHQTQAQYNSDNFIFMELKDMSEKDKKLDEITFVIKKLSMAYLKNKDYDKSIDFINKLFNDKIINERYKYELIDTINVLWKDIENLPISENINDTKISYSNVLKEITNNITKEEESLFITLFTAIISQE